MEIESATGQDPLTGETKVVTAPPAEAPVQIPPHEEAAMKFSKLLPYVTKLGKAMPSKKALVRVLKAFAEFPVGSTKPRLLSEQERQMFMILNEITGYKTTVINHYMKEAMELEKTKQAAESGAEGKEDVTNEKS